MPDNLLGVFIYYPNSLTTILQREYYPQFTDEQSVAHWGCIACPGKKTFHPNFLWLQRPGSQLKVTIFNMCFWLLRVRAHSMIPGAVLSSKGHRHQCLHLTRKTTLCGADFDGLGMWWGSRIDSFLQASQPIILWHNASCPLLHSHLPGKP